MSNSWHYKRPNLARSYAMRLQDNLFSRMALIGSRRIGKTAFLLNDLAPELIKQSSLPIYISLWSDRFSPQTEFIAKLEAAIHAIKHNTLFSSLMLAEVTKLSVNGFIAKIDVDLKSTKAESNELQTIRKLLSELIYISKGKRVVLLIDEIQHLITDKAFDGLQYALRSMFDEVGGAISVLYTGSSRIGMSAMFENKDLPFFHSAQPTEFPTIDDGFVKFCTEKLSGYDLKYSDAGLLEFWHSVDCSPYWMIILMRHLVMEQCTLEKGIAHITNLVREDGGFEKLLPKLTKIEKLVLLRMSRNYSLYSEKANDYYQKYGIIATRSKIQTAISKLVTKRLITKLPAGTFLLEVEGLISAIISEIEKN